jgi:uncharacterized protein with PIN domain
METFNGQKPKFFIDAMLGRLNRWLRVLGYDTICRRVLEQDLVLPYLKDGRILLTRHRKRSRSLERAVLLIENRVGDQLIELRSKLQIDTDHSCWFSRCIICNELLAEAPEEKIKENVPDYVYQENISKIRFCPICGRYYWPGTHRNRMEEQLRQWGF